MTAIRSNSININQTTNEPWFNNDKWLAEEIGLMPDITQSCYYLNFSRFLQPWFKKALKQFVLLQSATKSYSSCRSYITNLCHFSKFLALKYPHIIPEEITRRIVVEYMIYLNQCQLSQSTRYTALTHLKTFHTIVLQEKWLALPYEPLIYVNDMPKATPPLPRFIPESVISQMKIHLHHLPEHMQHFITVLLETGRRVSEICTLPYDCLERDGMDDAFLRIHDKKLKKHYLIPISLECLNAIKNQQIVANRIVAKQGKEESVSTIRYLFPTPSPLGKRFLYIRARHISTTLNRLAKKYNIINENGIIWHFHPHQFRHTIGTRMINAGVPQAIVQRYLGHETPEMTARYAYIHLDTLKKSFQKFQGTVIDIQGTSRAVSVDQQDAFLLKQHIMTQALPNGLCGLPLVQQRCPHANACLSCTHFRTHKGFLPQHETQLKETERIIDAAKVNGWQRQVEMNITVKQNLEVIIERLKKEPEHE